MTSKDEAILDWQRRLAIVADERDELRADLDLAKSIRAAEELRIDELRAENERLKADPYKAGYIDGHHAAHARRNESYRDCPRCS
jgi:hypothetical protein